MKKIMLSNVEPEFNADSDSLAKVISTRLGLLPRKKGANNNMHKILLELYERMKNSTREKMPENSIMTVEEMATLVNITKQTMYEYLDRWLTIEIIIKVSFVGRDSKIIRGYRLNGSTLEDAFTKVKAIINNNIKETEKYIIELQKQLKNEKIRNTIARKKENQF